MSTGTIEKTQKLELLSEVEFKEKQGVSQTEYAEMRNMTRQNVSKHVLAGVITSLPNGNIDPEAADKEMAEKLDPSFRREKKTNTNTSAEQPDKKSSASTGSFHDEKQKNLKIKTALSMMDLKKRAGELVNTKEVKKAYYNKITAVARKLQKVADKVSVEVAMESDRLKCRKIIYNEIKASVEDFGLND